MAATTLRHIQEKTRSFLQQIRQDRISPDQIGELRDVLSFHEHRYYVQNDPLISDFEYDSLYKQLEAFEKENPDLVVADSPTQRVAKELTKEFPSVQP